MSRKKIVLMRHGDYDKESEHLTEFGRAAVQRMTERLRSEEDIHPDIILTAPTIRGQESAAIAAEVYNVNDEAVPGPCIIDELDEGTRGKSFVTSLRNMSDRLTTIFGISHQGTIGKNILELLPVPAKMEVMSDNSFSLNTAEAVVLEFEVEHWSEVTPDSAAGYHLVRSVA